MDGLIEMNVDVFWETFVGFLKFVVLQLFPKYSQSYVNLIVKNRVIRDVCSFEDITQSRFHAKLFKRK